MGGVILWHHIFGYWSKHILAVKTGFGFHLGGIKAPRSATQQTLRMAKRRRRRSTTGKRRPKTPPSDAALLELIRGDLNTSPFQGEGHRKVGARLRVRENLPTAAARPTVRLPAMPVQGP